MQNMASVDAINLTASFQKVGACGCCAVLQQAGKALLLLPLLLACVLPAPTSCRPLSRPLRCPPQLAKFLCGGPVASREMVLSTPVFKAMVSSQAAAAAAGQPPKGVLPERGSPLKEASYGLVVAGATAAGA